MRYYCTITINSMTTSDKKDKEKIEYTPQTGTLRERLSRVKPTRWARFGIVAAIYVAWTVWMGNPWLLLALPLLALAAGMVYILYTRIKEIDGGEEDDLSNY